MYFKSSSLVGIILIKLSSNIILSEGSIHCIKENKDVLVIAKVLDDVVKEFLMKENL